MAIDPAQTLRIDDLVFIVVGAGPGAIIGGRAGAVLEHSRSVLAHYKAPKYVVVAEALPKNPSGKILKRELRDAHAGLAQDDTGTP